MPAPDLWPRTGTLAVMTTRHGLVLAGGGLAGIAWETGILRGIADEAPAAVEALLGADVLLGTSAGSTVAAQIGSGVGIDELYARQTAETSYEIDSGVDIDDITELFITAMTVPGLTALEKLQRIGAIALATDTVPPSVRREVIAHRLPSHRWPDRILRITAIDVATGELVVFDGDSGVDLVDAVAASCAVPGAWPPVVIGDRTFIDGGVASTANMAAAGDCEAVVALVPSGRTTPSPFGAGPAAEIAAFPGATLALFADDDALAAFGPNPLDPRCRIPSAIAGREQGRRVAGAVAEFLSG
jgi:NTE family protein